MEDDLSANIVYLALCFGGYNTGLRETRSVCNRLHVKLFISRGQFIMPVQLAANLGWAPANHCKSQSSGYDTRRSRDANSDIRKPGETSAIDRVPANIFPPPQPQQPGVHTRLKSGGHGALGTDHEHGFGPSKRSCTMQAPKRLRTETSCWLTGASIRCAAVSIRQHSSVRKVWEAGSRRG